MLFMKNSGISKDLKKYKITEGDLSLLFNTDLDIVLTLNDDETDKVKFLKMLYFNPYLLYEEIENLDEDFVSFTLDRYTIESSELLFQLENGDISKEEYVKCVNNLNKCYFDDTICGKNIRRIAGKTQKEKIK